MKVSIITVALNAVRSIADTLSSVASQSYKDIEHIVIDGGSTDGTQEVVQQFPHVVKFISEKDDGLYFAMNKGLQFATGDVVVMLNADDEYINNEVISKVVKNFQIHNSDVVYGDLIYVHPKDKKIIRAWKTGSYSQSKFYLGWMVPHPTLFVKREFYERLGGFNTTLKYAADYELMLRFMFKQQITTFYIPETLVVMKAGGKSNSSFKNRWTINREDKKAWTINHLKPRVFTLILKPLRKITQYINL